MIDEVLCHGRMISKTAAAALLFLFLAANTHAGDAGTAKMSWEGKTLTFSVGYGPGGGADVQGRIMAIHLPQFLPGSPRVVVTNKPGGGTRVNAIDMAVRPADGTYIGNVSIGLLTASAMGADPKFDWAKYEYLGMIESDATQGVMCARADRIKNLNDFLKAGRKWTLGEIGPSTTLGKETEWYKIVGLPVNVVYGYGGSAEVAAAFDRGEMDLTMRCDPVYAKKYPEWFTKNYALPLFWHSTEPKDWFPLDTPLYHNFKKGAYPWFVEIHEALKEVVTKDQFAAFDAFRALTGTHVWALPPGTPKEVVKALQSAFNEMTKSKAFIKDMNSRDREVLPIAGEELVKRVNALKNQPPSVKAILEKMLKGRG